MKKPVLFQNQPAVEISRDSSRIVVAPEHGARLLRWEQEGREIVRWPDDADWSRILKVRGGDPVLFPFIARHFVDGKPELWRNDKGVVRPMPQHGFARDARFAVIDEADPCSLRMRLTDSPDTRAVYPFAFRFDVVIELLAASSLFIRFETTNTGSEPLPYYAGHHFYLAIPHTERGQWTLDLPCAAWGWQNPDGSIRHEKPGKNILSLGDPALIDRFQIQPQKNTILLRHENSSRSLAFELDHPGSVPWYAVTTWTESPTADFYCVEPWLGLPNAIHHGEGLRHVAPGETETATCVVKAGGW